MAATDLLTKPPWWRQAHSLKTEIALAFGVVIALMLALGLTFYFSEQRSALALDKLLKIDSRMADLSLRSAQAMLKARTAESDFVLSVDRIGVGEARERYELQVKSHLLDMREYLTSFRIVAADPGLRDKIDRIEQLAQQYEDGFVAFANLYGTPGQIATVKQIRQDYVDAMLAIEPLLEDLHTVASKRAIQTRGGVESAARITRWTIIVTVTVAALLGALIAIIVGRRITGAVAQLIAFSTRIAAGDFSARAASANEREFAILAGAMNQMAAAIEQSQAQLLAAARQAGMAEIATNVLHNVGNVLNSVNVSAGLIGMQLHTSKLDGLARAVALIDRHADDAGEFFGRDPRGKLLPGYLRELAQALAGEHAAMAEEVGALSKSIEHIKAVVATQQSYAGAPRLVEALRLDELLDDALRINAGVPTPCPVQVVRQLPELPALPLDRNRLLQILVNLIGNAKQAMQGLADRRPCLTLAAVLVDGRTLRLTVADNGEGIAPEHLPHLFAHGFTTRRNGHGFGLHSCVLAAQEMGGSLRAQSDGAGKGACFILELPLDAPEDRR